ncbi:MAG: glucose-6-phosphate dehydrogenase [Candidatus Eremiobacteraeota bacterium]|nr:glucose-6-phosphate dehydrogenase [Candidatus Eremiobacteraeota bacterium]
MADTAVAPGVVPRDGAILSNPLREGLESNRIADPCNIVFFGASGDLFKRMLLPAMYNLRLEDVLPTSFGIIGFSRTEYTSEQFRDYCKQNVDQFSRSGPAKEPMWSDFASKLAYIAGDFSNGADFAELKALLEANDAKLGTQGNRLFYLSTPPSIFPLIIEQLSRAALGPTNEPDAWTRIIVEKPFGADLQSAQALQAEVEKVFAEKHVYRIDHYLGKEPVQDILALRFANMIFEPLWNRQYVDCVQITAAETLGIEQRGAYYDNAGTLRDMIQNHVMNLLALVAMEPPVNSGADSIRNEKFKVLSAVRPVTKDEVFAMSARGQYAMGIEDGVAVRGYREESDVRTDSNTETYAAVKLFIDNWRWADVPFYLRSGKRLARKNSEIAVRFSPIPQRLFGELSDTIEPNVLVMKIQPEEGISLTWDAKVPGPKNHIRAVSMDFNYGTGFGIVSAPAYERLISDALRGDATLFTRWDAVQRAWEIVMPVLDTWQNTKDVTFPNYPAGSQGPPSADELCKNWRKI